MATYNQDVLIDKINQYLKFQGRNWVLQHGYCHGLSLLWLYTMTEGREKWFYDAIKKIILCSDKTFRDVEIDIEKMLVQIEWLQNSSDYTTAVEQMDIERLFEVPEKFSLSYVFNQRELSSVLESVIQKNKMMCLSGPGHSIGVYQRGDKYYIFDPNYDEGEPKIYDKLKELKYEIIRCLFTEFDLYTAKLPIAINIVENPMVKEKKSDCVPLSKMSIFKKLINGSEKVNSASRDGTTPLHIASECGDVDEVGYLLKVGADPNRKKEDGTMALLSAATYGYDNVVDKLLEYKANPNIVNSDKKTPLHFAAQYDRVNIAKSLLASGAKIHATNANGNTALHLAAKFNHESAAMLLLEQGANVVEKNLEEKTALTYAIKEKNWRFVVNMILYVKNVRDMPKSDLELLDKNSKDIIATLLAENKKTPIVDPNQIIKQLFKLELNKQKRVAESTAKPVMHKRFKPYPSDAPIRRLLRSNS